MAAGAGSGDAPVRARGGTRAAPQRLASSSRRSSGSWQGDDGVQFVELQMLADGQNELAGGRSSRSSTTGPGAARRRFFTFQRRRYSTRAAGARRSDRHARSWSGARLPADYVLPRGLPRAARGARRYQAFVQGPWSRSIASRTASSPATRFPSARCFGRRRQPDALVRVDVTGHQRRATGNRCSAAAPEQRRCSSSSSSSSAAISASTRAKSATATCSASKTCASLGFAKGTLVCRQCHLDTSGCTACGNGGSTTRSSATATTPAVGPAAPSASPAAPSAAPEVPADDRDL